MATAHGKTTKRGIRKSGGSAVSKSRPDELPRISSTQIGIGFAAVALGGAALFNFSRTKAVEQEHPRRGQMVTVDGVDLHYVESGTAGPVILLLHGNGTTLEDWFACGIFQELSKANRVIAFDRPGFGYSSRPRARIWSPAAQADVLALALKSIGADNITAVGHSFATQVSIELALRHPELVQGLALISGYYYPSTRLDVLPASVPAIPIIGDLDRYTAAPLLGAAMRPILERKMFAPAPVASSWGKFPFGMTLRPSQIRAEAAEAAMMVPSAARLATHYTELTLPVQIISGDGDRIVDHASQSSRLASELSAELTTLRGVGHMAHHTATDRVLHSIRHLMSEHSTILDEA